MKIQAKEILIIAIGIITLPLITIFSKYFKFINLENPTPNDIFILLILVVIVIIYVIYKRTGEIDKEIDDIKQDYDKLNEKLKIHSQLINLEARIISLEKETDNGGKK